MGVAKKASERGSAFYFVRKVPRPHARAILLLIILWLLLTLILVWPKMARWRDNTPSFQAPLPGGYNYLIVAPLGFQSIAQSWGNYRQSTSYQVGIMLVDGYEAAPEYVRWIVHQTYERSGRPYPFYVLLLGHAHPHSNFPQNYLPASGLELANEHAAILGFNRVPSDGAYAKKPGSDAWLPIAIGRVPALTEEMAFSVLERIRQYENYPPQGPGRARLEMITSSNDWGPTFDRLANELLAYMLNRRLPDYVQVNALSGNPLSPYSYPPADFPAEVARRFDAGSMMISYIGHGTRRGLAPAVSQTGEDDWIFTLSDLRLLQNANNSIAAFVACEVGEFDLPGNHLSLAESLFLTSDGLIATYAGSRITF
ncbi:MAG: C25 family cysteine peptidase, partial [Anaerolineales bacterium]